MINQKYLVNHYKKLFKIEKYDLRNANLRKIVINELIPGSVVDVGSGTGLLATECFLMGHKPVWAVDVEEELLDFVNKNARKKKAVIKTKKIDIKNLKKLGKNKFDNVICLDVIEHIRDDFGAVKNFYYILKPGGRLILNVPAFSFLYGKRDKSMGHLRRYSKLMLFNILEGVGFKVKKITYWNMLGFWVYFISERILGKRVNEDIRYKPKTFVQKLLNKIIFWWMERVESKLIFPLGLSVFAVCEKTKK